MQTNSWAWMLPATVFFFCGTAKAQDAPAANPPPEPRAPQSEIRRAIRWKPFEYTCAGGEKVSVYLSDRIAKVLFQGHQYLMKQTVSADGNRYSDGQLVWWSKGEGGFLQKDSPDGKFLAKDCKLDKPSVQTSVVSGTVAYRQRMALPPEAVIEVQLRELPADEGHQSTTLVAEDKVTLGNRQVPVPFDLRFDAAKIKADRVYDVKARILVGQQVWFSSGQAYPVLTQGNPSHVDMILDQVGTESDGNEKR